MTNGKSERKRQTGKKKKEWKKNAKRKETKRKERNDIDSLISRYFEGKCQR